MLINTYTFNLRICITKYWIDYSLFSKTSIFTSLVSDKLYLHENTFAKSNKKNFKRN